MIGGGLFGRSTLAALAVVAATVAVVGVPNGSPGPGAANGSTSGPVSPTAAAVRDAVRPADDLALTVSSDGMRRTGLAAEPYVPPISEPAVTVLGRPVSTVRALGVSTPALTTAPVCDDGVSGKRIQVLYVRGSSEPNTYATSVETIREAMVFNDSLVALSRKSGEPEMRMRLVHSGSSAGCVISVLPVVVPQFASQSLGGIIDALQARPEFQDPNRKYLFFAAVDNDFECGLAASYRDDSPGGGNANNGYYPTHGGVGRACWDVPYDYSDPNAIAPVHEVFHMLGAVSDRAPNASAAGHCTDESDLMCYADGPGVVMTYDNGCGGAPQPTPDFNNNIDNYRLDCNRDDYFDPRRPSSGFLKTNWNTANNDFLYGNQGDRFVALSTPLRAYDSRTDRVDFDGDGSGDIFGPLSPFEIPLPLTTSPANAGNRTATVPWDATGVVLNVTAVDPTVPLNVTVWPTGLPKPVASSLNVTPGNRVANQVVVKLGNAGLRFGSGSISLATNRGTAHVVVDVVGYFSRVRPQSGASFNAVTPVRVLDSRGGPGPFTTPWGPGQVRRVPIVAAGSPVPANATAVVLNVTATNGTAPRSHLRVFPSGRALPSASSLNYRAGQNIPNQVTVGLRNGAVDVYQHAGTADVVVDVVGYYAPTGSVFVPVANTRIVDTRPETRIGPLTTFTGSRQTQSIRVTGRATVPAGATGVVLNVTGVNATTSTNVRLYPDGVPVPTTSNLNLVPGLARPNAVTVGLSPTGSIAITNFRGSVDVVIDVVGYTFTG